MLLRLQEGALEAPQAGVGDALFQHDVITHPAATATDLGGAGLASSRAASWRATQPSEAWVSSVGYKPELGRTAVTSTLISLLWLRVAHSGCSHLSLGSEIGTSRR